MQGPTIAFIMPYWGTDPYRQKSFHFQQNFLMKFVHDWELDPVPMGYIGRGTNISRSGSRNDLARTGKNEEILIFLDADSIPDPAALYDSIGYVVSTKQWLFPYSRYYNLTPKGSEAFMKDPPWPHWQPEDSYEYEYVFPGPDPVDRPPADGGCLIVHREAFEKVRGYDERFIGWGGEDRAMVLALETLVGEQNRYPAAIYHLWHPNPPSERFEHPNWAANQQLLKRYQEARLYRTVMHDLVKER